MPSKSYINFLHIRMDVLKLIETHTYYTKNKSSNTSLGHLTRSAIVMLCAAWERYNEDLLIEAIENICDSITDINLLNKKIKKTISSKVKQDKNESKPIELAGDGWKSVWKSYAVSETKVLHTPKSNKLKALFDTYLGIPDYTKIWSTTNPDEIDTFVSVRGDIAHNGNKASYANINKLRVYQDMIVDNVINIDSNIADEIARMTGSTDLPWEKNYYTDLKKYK